MSGSRAVGAMALVFALAAACPALADETPRLGTPSDDWYSNLSPDDLIGKDVTSTTGDDVAEVDGIVVDPKARDIYAVLSVANGRDTGLREVTVPLNELRPGANEALIMSLSSKRELEERPAYKEEGELAPLLGSQSLAEVPR